MNLDTIKPTMIIDTREQAPLDLPTLPSEIGTLPVGDYGIKGFSDWQCPGFVIERKSIEDLAGSMGKGRDRFRREAEKMRQFGFAAIVIEGGRSQVELGQYRSKIYPISILSGLDAFAVRAGIHIIWAGSRPEAAERIENLARMFARGVLKDAKRMERALVTKQKGGEP